MFDNDLGIDTSWCSNHFYLYYQGDNLYNLLYDLKWKTETKSIILSSPIFYKMEKQKQNKNTTLSKHFQNEI
jgi:hypothetical protein